MAAAKENEEKIIKMQANIRVFLQRKHVNPSIKQSARNKKRDFVPSHKNKPPGIKSGDAYAMELSELPDHSNDNVKATE